MEKANTHRLDFFFFFFFFDPMNDPLKEEQSPKKKKQNDKASGRRGGGGAHQPGELKGERERVIVARRIYRSEEKMRRPNFESLANNPGFQYPHPKVPSFSFFFFFIPHHSAPISSTNHENCHDRKTDTCSSTRVPATMLLFAFHMYIHMLKLYA